MAVGTYPNLVAWQSSMALVEEIYRLTARLPVCERYGLTQQLRRAAISVPSNIAEGNGRRSSRDFARYLVMALGSLAELETQLLVAARIGFVSPDDAAAARRLVDRTGRLLRGLERGVSRRSGAVVDR